MNRAELRELARTRAGGACQWPKCGEAGAELAHCHSIGMGGRESADTPDNVVWLCHEHARNSDGEHSDARTYRESMLNLLPNLLDIPLSNIGWERAEALRRLNDG